MSSRIGGFLKLLVGGIVFAIALQYFSRKGLNNSSMPGGPIALIAVCTPGAIDLAGLIEVVSGVPFTQLSSNWDNLKGWQRGILGLLIVVLAFAMIFAGILLFA
jgi:hypothetical protein